MSSEFWQRKWKKIKPASAESSSSPSSSSLSGNKILLSEVDGEDDVDDDDEETDVASSAEDEPLFLQKNINTMYIRDLNQLNLVLLVLF